MNTPEPALRRQAIEAIESGQHALAETLLRRLLESGPDDVPVRMELAAAIIRQGRIREATWHLLEAVPSLPNNAELIARLAWQLALQGEVPGARACLAHLARAPNPPSHVLVEQAHLHWMLGDIEAAAGFIERANALGLDGPAEHYLRGMLLQFTGRLGEAETVLTDLLEHWPGHADAVVILANLRRQTAQDNLLQRLDRWQARLGSPTDPRGRFAVAEYDSARFKVLDDLGQYEAAWAALQRCNAIMHQLHPYDGADELATVESIEQAAARLDPAPPRQSAPAGQPAPLFIVGLPRSGSTLLDHMLSAHPEIVSAGEISDFQRQLHWVADVAQAGHRSLREVMQRMPSLDLPLVGKRYLERTAWRAAGARYFIDKLPINVRLVPFIRRALPQARIIHIVRPPMDVCYSNLKVMFGSASPYCYDMQAMAHYHGLYRQIVERWRQLDADAMLEVAYEDLVTDPEAALSRILAHCGLPMDSRCLHPEANPGAVATPSSAQVREPLHRRALEQWRRYESQLEPLRRALGSAGG
ncbi:tetratricopeptide repeat-containing sulfotransferase family protein [Dyella ginsengisoli]|uniref:tetratricopeptide repeat-containing sulfotransferase family protein n=1 Tax=Dyella ginsengisoli TaxID=363848 RepID=UPI00034C6D3F|nr:tetratricopeptide repeat-containing sulfotransferase family protein [Dyella ginsengisoli]